MGAVKDAEQALRDAQEDLAGETARLGKRVELAQEALAVARDAEQPTTSTAAAAARWLTVREGARAALRVRTEGGTPPAEAVASDPLAVVRTAARAAVAAKQDREAVEGAAREGARQARREQERAEAVAVFAGVLQGAAREGARQARREQERAEAVAVFAGVLQGAVSAESQYGVVALAELVADTARRLEQQGKLSWPAA
jgi:hypothetical protein